MSPPERTVRYGRESDALAKPFDYFFRLKIAFFTIDLAQTLPNLAMGVIRLKFTISNFR